MKGDFSALRDERKKRYTQVLKQQGRVDLDRDWNEQMQIQSRLDRIRIADIVGPCGAPKTGGGFKIGAYRSLGAHLYDVHFVDPMTGWAVGNMGIILATRDGGNTWFPQMSGINACFHGVCFVDASRGWIVGHTARTPVILATDNGGETWKLQTLRQLTARRAALMDVCFVNESHGWAVGHAMDRNGANSGLVLATRDGGQHWDVDSMAKEHGILMGVCFMKESLGFAVGLSGTVLIYSAEEGWQPFGTEIPSDMQFFDVDYIDEATICAVGVQTKGASIGPGIIVRMRDGEPHVRKQAGTFFHGVSIFDESSGWVVGFDYSSYIVREGGDSDLQDIHLLDADTQGVTGAIWATNDGGKRWSQTDAMMGRWAGVSFVNRSRGWAVGRGLGPHLPAITSTANGGTTWADWEPPHDGDLAIWDGRMYADGVLCELESPTTYLLQPDYLDPPPLSPPPWKDDKDGYEKRSDLVFLDVWQRHLTAIEDSEIRETALGGPDTTTRVKTVWQVKVQQDVIADKCMDNIQGWPPSPSQGRMSTKLSNQAVEQKPCEVVATGEYRGLGNQLYRIEVHDGAEPYSWPRPQATAFAVTTVTPEDQQLTVVNPPGSRQWRLSELVEVFSKQTDALESKGLLARIVGVEEPQQVGDDETQQVGDDETQQVFTLESLTDSVDLHTLAGHAQVRLRRVASCKWSRDNGSVAFAIEQFVTNNGPSTNQLVVRGVGRSPAMELHPGDWVEVSDDVSELKGEPGTLAQLSESVDPEKGIVTLSRDISGYRLDAHPKLRRWDQRVETIAITNDWIDLEEHGIQISFSGSNFKSADYWVFTARAGAGEIETLDNEPPRGIQHDYCPLALVMWKDDGTADVTDLRQRFPASAELASCFYLGGDGQEGSPGDPLAQPLRVGVAQGEWPLAAATVGFRVLEGNGELRGPDDTGQEILVPTDEAGVAECIWVLGNETPDQVVEAKLVDACGHPLHLPIRFYARFGENGQPNGLCWKLGGNEINDPARDYLGTRNQQAMEIRVDNARALRLEPGNVAGNPAPNVIGGAPDNSVAQGISGATIGGGYANKAAEAGATISGGRTNIANGEHSAVGGGSQNKAIAKYATVAGGHGNAAEAAYSTIAGGGPGHPRNDTTVGNRVTDDYGAIGGGGYNQAGNNDGDTSSAMYATVAGGLANHATDSHATIGGGQSNIANGESSAIGGGNANRADGSLATVPGGFENKADGELSFAAGCRAEAGHRGALVWADYSLIDGFASENENQFSVRATGGVRFVTSTKEGQPAAGVRLAAQASSWSQLSSRQTKANYVRANSRAILEQLAKLPIASWNYSTQDPSIRHLGPVAEDFYAAFGLGEDERYISTVDAEGVALAAIQGLYQVLQGKDVTIANLKTETDELRLRIEKLEASLSEGD